MDQSETRASIGPVQVGVVILALATAVIHLYGFLAHGFLGNADMLPLFQFLFVGNFLAYLILLAVLYLPSPSMASLRPFARVLLSRFHSPPSHRTFAWRYTPFWEMWTR